MSASKSNLGGVCALNFFLHVHYKPQDAVARGLRMPALSYMSEDDARSLWLWLGRSPTIPCTRIGLE